MNVFDVLREKLEESQDRYDDVAFAEMNTNGHTLDFEYANGKKDGVSESIEIANQVEQEYNNGWIDCTKELPPQPKPNPEFECKPLELYLVSMNDSKYPWRAFWNGKDFTDGWRVVYPTAWQPLPPKYEPKGE